MSLATALILALAARVGGDSRSWRSASVSARRAGLGGIEVTYPSDLLLAIHRAFGRLRTTSIASAAVKLSSWPPATRAYRYPADPPTVEEIIAAMHTAGEDNDAVRLRGLIVVLWRAGLRISEALAVTESDLACTAARSWSAY